MARIPDSTALGERVQPRTGGQAYISRGAEIAAAGMAETAASIGQTVKQFAQQDDAFNFARARSAMLNAEAGIRKQLETDQDWQTHEQRYGDVMKEAREESGKLIKGNRSRALFEQEADTDIQRGAEGVRTNARRLEGNWGRSELDSVLDANRRSALESQDKAQRDQLVLGSLDAITGARDKGYITPEQGEAERQQWARAYGEGFVDILPDGQALKILRNPKGTEADFIDPARRAQMIDRLETKIRVKSDQREAKAERAVGQFQSLIASGLPATPEMWTTLKGTVAGTSMQGEFDGLVAGEKEVQETLRKPIAEQERLAQTKREALMNGGGTLKDLANVTRLENAVKQNVALIQNAPLVYAEQRNGDQNVPLDITGIIDPNQQQATGAVLQDRASTIAGLRKTLGAAVPMKPLLPQESQQLVMALDKSSPQQAAEIFAGLSKAAGSPDVYKGIMSQVAPDAPVKAFAGMLASNQRELVTGHIWFDPDPFVKSTDVAATVLRGERLLNPSKGEKTEDGKPKTQRLLLPSEAQTELQTKFAKEVGTAFAGRPEVADRAYQAVQAYYVGRAAEKGQLAENSQMVDTKLVREAVKATLGNVVDYNDSQVLAPWGMTTDDFEDRVERRFSAEAKRLGLPENITPQLSSFGLVNTDQEGVYGVKLGEKLLLNPDRSPVTVNIRQDPVRGVIQR